jgi:hypothetical protein
LPWTVRLQDERGKPVIPVDAVIEFAVLPENERSALLRYIDPYGDTYFNRIQMDDFLADWAKVTPPNNEREQWQLVQDMATRCQAEPHLYLRFIGD